MERSTRWFALLAGLLVLPAAVFVAANVLKYGMGLGFLYDALGPFAEPQGEVADAVVTSLVLFGPVLALLAALFPVVRFRIARSDGAVDATARLRLRWENLGVAVVALGVMAVVGGHLLAENAACWFGSAGAC